MAHGYRRPNLSSSSVLCMAARYPTSLILSFAQEYGTRFSGCTLFLVNNLRTIGGLLEWELDGFPDGLFREGRIVTSKRDETPLDDNYSKYEYERDEQHFWNSSSTMSRHDDRHSTSYSRLWKTANARSYPVATRASHFNDKTIDS